MWNKVSHSEDEPGSIFPKKNIDCPFDNKYGWSVEVLARDKRKRHYIATYNHNGKVWSIKGTSLTHNIVEWQYINN